MEVDFSVVLPAYNEAPRIISSIESVRSHLSAKGSFEIIVVDDGSADGTAAAVESARAGLPELTLLRLSPNRGKGAAVREGMLRARGRVRIFLDADLGIPVAEMDKLVPFAAEGYDCVIGSKKVPGARAEVSQPWLRRFLGKGYSVVSEALLVPGIRDFTCGIKLFTAKAAGEVFPRQRIERWGFDTEILYLAHRLGFRIKEVPVAWTHQPGSKVRVVRDVLNSARDLLAILRNRAAGVYR
jgi:dolichyl-phosphate beta-glucosyltransferase